MNRAMLGRMVMSAGVARLPRGTALVAVAGNLTDASAAVTAGADLIDLGAATAETITAFRSRHPGIPICAAGGPAAVVRDPAVARVTGALLLCADADAAVDRGIPPGQILVDVLPAAVPKVSQAGLAALVDVDSAAGLAALADVDSGAGLAALADMDSAAGLAALADVDSAAGLASRHDAADRDPADGGPADRAAAGSGLTAVAGIVALAALSSWLGARAVRTSYPVEVRHALDMTASVRGTRPPARTVRGLA